MTWNYRIVRRETKHGDETTAAFGVHEAYYDKAGHCHSITQESMEPFGETYEELQRDMAYMLEAFGKPVLDYETREPWQARP